MIDLRPLLVLLEERHGVGRRGDLPGWMKARIERAVTALAARERVAVREAIARLGESDELLAELADALRVGETSFFRDPAQWAALRRAVIPSLPQSGRLAGMSVGCSTGEEAWTLAMCVAEARRIRGGLAGHVAGIDRSVLALETAGVGLYPPEAVRNVPQALAGEYLIERHDAFAVTDELRALVRFSRKDVARTLPPGRWQIIVCKNVLIYFGEDAGLRLVERLLAALDDGGVLLVARSEVPRVRAAGAKSEDLGEGITVFRT